jgi:hypothetical protein
MMSIFGFGRLIRIVCFELGEEVDVRRQLHLPDVGAGDHGSVDVDRIAGWGPAPCHRGRAWLAPDGRCLFDPMVTIASVSGSNSHPTCACTSGKSHGATAGCLDTEYPCVSGRWTVSTSLSTMCCGCGTVRVAHAEVDDVLALPARGHLEFGRDGKDVRGRRSMRANCVSRGGPYRSFFRKRPEPSERRK